MEMKRIISIATLALTLGGHPLLAAERPMIEANKEEKARVLALVEKYDWAAELYQRLQDGMADKVAAHKADPAKAMAAAPPFLKSGVHSHVGWLRDAETAGTLYFMTGKEDYAQLAADRLNGYVQFLSVEGRDPIVSTGRSGGRQRDYRDVYDKLALAYDYTHPFLIKDGTTVLDAESGKRIPFDHAKAQLAFAKIVDYGMKHSERGGNIEIMIFDSLLYSALCIEDKTRRDAYVDQLMNTYNGRNTGLLNMKNIMIRGNGVWPESSSYSGVGNSVPGYMEVIDRLYPEYKIFDGFEEALGGLIQRSFYVYPNGSETLCFGDSHRTGGEKLRTGDTFNRAINRAGFESAAQRVFGKLKADRVTYGYKPNNLWTMDPLEGFEPAPITTQALHLPYAGLAMQNNLHCTDPKQHGLMYYTAGANYVHAQLSGLDLELYGAGNVMSGVGGSGDPNVKLPGVAGRNTFRFITFFRNYAGHNTVVVNGESTGAKKGWKGYNQMWMDTVKLQSMEPMPFTPAASKEFTFSCQQLDDTVNKAVQQRTVSIVRTSDTTGYYFDLFRSRSKGENKFHDYIYRNIGDAMTLTSGNGTALPLTPDKQVERTFEKFTYTDWERYQSKPFTPPSGKDYPLLFPGWHFFSDVAYSKGITDPVAGRFDLTSGKKRHMHVAMPGGVEREYTTATAPEVYEAVKPYDKRPSRVLSIRQPGEAWDRPFIVVFEPSTNDQPTVQSVENLMDGEKIVGAKVVSVVNGNTISDWIIAQDKPDATYRNTDLGLEFTGRFAIARTIKSDAGNELVLYIGEGENISFGKYELSADEGGKGYRSFIP
jgi:hypothetical protein